MRVANESIGFSFDLPDWPSMGQIEDFQIKYRDLIDEHRRASGVPDDKFLPNIRLNALIHCAAFLTGLASNWQCARMADPLPDDPREADGVSINYSGDAIWKQITKWTAIPLA